MLSAKWYQSPERKRRVESTPVAYAPGSDILPTYHSQLSTTDRGL